MSGGRRGGERRRACATERMHRLEARFRTSRPADASFARSFDPCASILTMHDLARRKARDLVVGRSFRYHGWANPREWEEPALGPFEWAQHGSPRVTASARMRRGTSEPEGGRGLRPCEDQEPRLYCSHVVSSLQKSSGGIGPRISSANALPKERSGSSERGSSSERRSAGETVGRRVGRKDGRRVGLTRSDGERPARGPGWCESAIRRSFRRASGGAVVGPGL